MTGGVDSELDRYLIFRIGEEGFATPLLAIKEIVDPLPYCTVPNQHPYFLGLANLRGQIMGVIDLGCRLGLASWRQRDEEGVLLVIEEDGASLGAWVSRVESTLYLQAGESLEEPLVASPLPSNSYRGVLRCQEELFPVLSLLQLLRSDEHSLLNKGQSA